MPASRKPVAGAARIARVLAAVTRKEIRRGGLQSRLVRVNGRPGRMLRGRDGMAWSVLSVDVADGRIQTVRIMRNPDKLAHLRATGAAVTAAGGAASTG